MAWEKVNRGQRKRRPRGRKVTGSRSDMGTFRRALRRTRGNGEAATRTAAWRGTKTFKGARRYAKARRGRLRTTRR